jgi:hypothetical protein
VSFLGKSTPKPSKKPLRTSNRLLREEGPQRTGAAPSTRTPWNWVGSNNKAREISQRIHFDFFVKTKTVEWLGFTLQNSRFALLKR